MKSSLNAVSAAGSTCRAVDTCLACSGSTSHCRLTETSLPPPVIAFRSSVVSADPLRYDGALDPLTLIAELERREMSYELSTSLGPGASLDRVLLDVDSASASGSALVRGPFSVFQVGQPPAHLEEAQVDFPEAPYSSSDASILQDAEDASVGEVPTSEWSLPVNEVPDLDFVPQSIEDDYVGDLSLFTMDTSAFLLDYTDDCHGSSTLPFALDGSQPACLLLHSPAHSEEDHDLEHDGPAATQEIVSAPPSICMSPGRGDKSLMPEDAGSLLRNYKRHLETTSISMQTKRKSPWQVIFLPCALETFSELTLWNTTSHTHLAILTTLLAHSAFLSHRSNRPNARGHDWRSVGIGHLNKAQSHLKVALEREVTGPDQVPYKELLMAILALAVASVGDIHFV